MSHHLERAILLLQQSRLDLARQELLQALALDPNDAQAHAWLSLCFLDEKDYDQAMKAAQQAVHLEPDMPFAHYMLAKVFEYRNRPKEARAAVGEAIRLDPYDARNFALLSQIELNDRNWAKSLEAAEAGLRVDPENVQCTNLRAMALVKLGRRAEAGATIHSALARDPEDAVTHANMGWRYLHEANPTKAMEHFREALRLEPGLTWAQQGIIEAMKAKNVVYRILLAYFLWMSRLSRRAQWAVILGGYFGFKMLSELKETRPELSPYIYPLMIAYMIFALLTWIGDPLFNLLLRFNKFGKLVLTSNARRSANVMAIGLTTCALAAIVYFWTKQSVWLMLVVILGTMTMVTSATIRASGGWPRVVMIVLNATLGLIGLMLVVVTFSVTDQTTILMEGAFNLLVTLYASGLVVFFLAANGLAMIRVRK